MWIFEGHTPTHNSHPSPSSPSLVTQRPSVLSAAHGHALSKRAAAWAHWGHRTVSITAGDREGQSVQFWVQDTKLSVSTETCHILYYQLFIRTGDIFCLPCPLFLSLPQMVRTWGRKWVSVPVLSSKNCKGATSLPAPGWPDYLTFLSGCREENNLCVDLLSSIREV